MADLNYTVDINTKGAQNSLNSLKTALAGLGVALGTGQIIEFADSITSLKNRLLTLQPAAKGLSNNIAVVDNQFKALVGIANNARAPLAQTGDLFFRIARAGGELGVSTREAAEITDTLAKALTSSGISAQEAAGPLLQLGQALQSGRFQGDELRSILEGMPVVTQALAQELDVPIGQLRQLGKEGKITGEVFVRAMRNARQGIIEAFGQTTPTISQAFEQIKTSSSLAFSEFEKNSQLGKNLAIALELLAMNIYKASKNIDEFAKTFKFFLDLAIFAANFFLIAKAVSLVGKAFTSIKASVAAASAGFSTLKTNFVAVGESLRKVGSGLSTTFRKVGESFRAFFNKAEKGSPILSAIGQLIKDLTGRFGYFVKGVSQATTSVVQFIASALKPVAGWLAAVIAGFADFLGLNDVVDSFNALSEEGSTAAEELAEWRAEMDQFRETLDETVQTTDKVVSATQEQVLAIKQSADAYHLQTQRMLESLELRNRLIGATDEERRIQEALASERERFADEEKRILDEIAQARANGTDEELVKIPLLEAALQTLRDSYVNTQQSIVDLIKAETDLTNAYNLQQFAIKQNIDLQNQLISLQDAAAKMTLTTLEQKYYDIDAAAKAAAKSAIEAEEARRGAPLSAEEIAQYYEEAAKGAEQLKQASKENYELSREFDTGWQQALNDFVERATDSAAQAKAIFQTFTKGIEDAFVNFVKTGKLSFKDLIMSMIEMIVRSKIQQLLGTLFGIGGGGGGGGVGGFFKSIFGLANGGPAQGGRPYIVGEQGPELFVPKTSGTVVPNDQMGTGQVVNNNTYVTNQISAVDAKSVAQLFVENRQMLLGSVQMAQKELP